MYGEDAKLSGLGEEVKYSRQSSNIVMCMNIMQVPSVSAFVLININRYKLSL